MGEASDSVWTEEPNDPMCKTLWVLPMRLLLVGRTGGRGLLLALLLVTLLGKARVTMLALYSRNLVRRLRTLVLSAISLGLKLTYDLTSDII